MHVISLTSGLIRTDTCVYRICINSLVCGCVASRVTDSHPKQHQQSPAVGERQLRGAAARTGPCLDLHYESWTHTVDFPGRCVSLQVDSHRTLFAYKRGLQREETYSHAQEPHFHKFSRFPPSGLTHNPNFFSKSQQSPAVAENQLRGAATRTRP